MAPLAGTIRDLCLADEPLTALLSAAAKRGDLLPAHLISEGFMAWQAAFAPRWDASSRRHILEFSPARLRQGVSSCLRSLRPGGAPVFHRVRSRAAADPACPKVLHVISRLEVGGSQKIVLDLAEGLGHRFRMSVLTGAVARGVRYEGIEVAVRPTISGVADELRRRRPELMHLHYWGPDPWINGFLDALDRVGDPAVPLLCNVNNPVPAPDHPWIAHRVFVSRFAAGIEPRRQGPASVIYPGVAPETWSARACRAEAPFPTVGMVYRLAPDKLDLSSIDAMIDIVARVPETRVLIPGGGPYLPRFVERVRRAGLRANFHFPGWVRFQDLPALYDQMDLFIAPVHTESFGIVVPYAMCKGVPVLGYRTGALPEILADERWLCSSREELVSRAAGLLRRRAEAFQAAQSLRGASRRFSLAAMLESYDALYRRLSARGTAGIGARRKAILETSNNISSLVSG